MVIRLATPALLATAISSAAFAQSMAPEDTARVIHQSRLGNADLKESSGLAASRREPGLLWTINDSGNPPELFATDSSGRDRGIYRIEGAENRDWEAMALAGCGRSDCLYVADVGDNRRRHVSVKLYRVAEPVFPSAPGGTVTPNGTIEFRYQDGPRNVEAILVTREQDVFLLSKEREGGARLYFLSRTAWNRGEVATAVFIETVPFPEGLGFQVTDAALGPDGVDLVIRTYSYMFFFRLEHGRLAPAPDRHRCYAAGLDAQGEGIAWLKNGRLATTSERIAGLGGTVSIVECR